MIDASLDQLLEVEDIGPVVAAYIVDFFNNPDNLAIIQALREAGVNWKDVEQSENQPLKGQTWVF